MKSVLMHHLVLLVVFCGAAIGAAMVEPRGASNTAPALAASTTATSSSSSGVTMWECLDDEQKSVWPCIKSRALVVLERANTMRSIPLLDGVSLDRDEPAATKCEGAAGDVDETLWSCAVNFLQGRSLRVKMFEDQLEGRGKLKKLAGPLLMALMMKKMMAAMALGGLALLAGKALLVSKLAFALSMIVALKKLLGGGGSTHETYEIVAKHPGHHDGGSASNHVPTVSEPGPGYFGRRRSFYNHQQTIATTDLPYRGYAQAIQTNQD